MFGNALKRLLEGTPRPAPAPATAAASPPPAGPTPSAALQQYFGQVGETTVPTYPGRCAALIAASPEELLATQEEVIFRIRDNCALNEAQFQSLVYPVLLRFAAYVHLLPASENHHHCGPGGLLRHGLEVCAHAARMAEGQYVGGDLDQGHRLQYAPRWKVAAMLAGLLHDMGKPVVDLGATDETGQLTWSAQVEPLWAWLQRNRLEHYYLYWRPGARHNRHLAMGATVSREILGPEMLAWLSEHRCSEVVDLLMVTLTETPELTNTMLTLVKKADSASVAADLAEQARRMAGTGQGANQSLAARFIAAMRRRVEQGRWRLNTEGCPVWWTDQGLVGIYPAFVDEVVADLRMDGARSLPSNRDDWLRLLADYQHLEQAVGEGEQQAILWDFIRLPPEGQKTLTAMVTARAAKFARPELVAGSIPLPAPMAAKLTPPFKADHLAAGGAKVQLVAPSGEPTPAAAATPPPAPATASPATPGAETAAASPVPDTPEVEDRRQRVDVATERAREREADPGKGANYAEMLRRLTDHSIHGAALAEIFKAIESQRLLYGVDLMLLDDAVAVRYPDAFTAAEVPTEGLPRFLADQGWLRTQEGVDRKSIELPFPSGAKTKALVMAGLPYHTARALQDENAGLMQYRPDAKPQARPARAGRRTAPPLVKDPSAPAPAFRQERRAGSAAETPEDYGSRLLTAGFRNLQEARKILTGDMTREERHAITAYVWGLFKNYCNGKNVAHIGDVDPAELLGFLDRRCQELFLSIPGVVEAMVTAEPPLWEPPVGPRDAITLLPPAGLRRDYTPPEYMVEKLARIAAGGKGQGGA